MSIDLIEGDCIDAMRQMSDDSVDAIVTDPPYGVGLKYATYSDNPDAYFPLVRAFMAEAQRIVKPDGFIVLTPGMKHLNWWYQEFPPTWTLAWYKSNSCARNALGGFNVWEPMLFWGKPRKRVGHDAISLPIKQQPDTGGHPCPKNYEAWSKFMLAVLPVGKPALVLDPFMGSGTTGVVCREHGWNFIGVEMDSGYMAVASGRLGILDGAEMAA